jgi:hypothetical protein
MVQVNLVHKPHPFGLSSILVLSSHLRLGLQSCPPARVLLPRVPHSRHITPSFVLLFGYYWVRDKKQEASYYVIIFTLQLHPASDAHTSSS